MAITDVNSANHTGAYITHWTDGAFPSNVQPAPLWLISTGNVYVEVAFAAAGTYNITIDGATNSNIGSIAMYDQATSTGASSPSGSLGTAVNFNSPSPGGLYGQAMGSITVASAGTYRLWFHFSGAYTFATIKYIDDGTPPPLPTVRVTQALMQVGSTTEVYTRVTQVFMQVGSYDGAGSSRKIPWQQMAQRSLGL